LIIAVRVIPILDLRLDILLLGGRRADRHGRRKANCTKKCCDTFHNDPLWQCRQGRDRPTIQAQQIEAAPVPTNAAFGAFDTGTVGTAMRWLLEN
jgi:hypothetical protein